MLIESSIAPKVRHLQELKVRPRVANLAFDMDSTVKEGFAARLIELCADKGLAAEHGRQTKLAAQFGVSPNAARKWLRGDGMPELQMAVEISEWAGVNVNWLLQGIGPKHGNRHDLRGIVLDEVMRSFPAEERREVLDYIKYKLDRARASFTSERLSRYEKALENFKPEADLPKQ